MIKYFIHIKDGNIQTARNINKKLQELIQNKDENIVIGSDKLDIYPFDTETNQFVVSTISFEKYIEEMKKQNDSM